MLVVSICSTTTTYTFCRRVTTLGHTRHTITTTMFRHAIGTRTGIAGDGELMVTVGVSTGTLRRGTAVGTAIGTILGTRPVTMVGTIRTTTIITTITHLTDLTMVLRGPDGVPEQVAEVRTMQDIVLRTNPDTAPLTTDIVRPSHRVDRA